MNHSDKMNQYHEKKKFQMGMGGEKKLKARKEAGKLNVRERIDYFFDSGTFQELGIFSHSARPGLARRTPTDGKIIGYGLVNGRPVGVIANDMTILGASSSDTNMKKVEYMRSVSCEKGMPLVFLGESSGARMPDVMGSIGMAHGGQNTIQYRRLREAPWISVLLGDVYGSSSWYTAMSDISIMQKGAIMAVSSPKVIQFATGEDTKEEELGGWRVHIDGTGIVDAVGDTEEDCMDLAKRYLGFLPAHSGEVPPSSRVPEGAGAEMENILALLPERQSQVYDMKKIIHTIMDSQPCLELKKRFGKACITAFSRLGGHCVGIVANNPMYGAGSLNADCCEKITSFLVLCDSFNIPVISFVDTPGFLIGKAGEQRKMVGKIINWMNALSLMSVPILTVIIRKLYGQAYLNMFGGKYSKVFAAWPTAEISFMGPQPAMNVVHNLKKDENPEEYERLYDEIVKGTEPWDAAGVFGVNEIIDPVETRSFLIRMLEFHNNKKTGGVGSHLLHNWPTTF